MKLPKLMYVEWVDAATTDGWTDTDCKTIGIDYCKSVGFVIRETKEGISLAAAISEKQCNAVISIPTSWIRKKRTIKL